MQDNQAEIMLKILESIDRRFEMLNTHLANITKVLSSTDDNVRALRITSAENPASPAPKPRLENPNEGQPRERLVGVAVTVLDGTKRYSKNAETGAVKIVFLPAERDIGNGRKIFTRLAVRQEQGGEPADRFNAGDVLTVSGTLQRDEYNGKPRTTLWADEIIEPPKEAPRADDGFALSDGRDEPFPQEDEDVPF